MPRLINADSIKFTEYINGDITVSKNEIQNMPVAFDLESIIEQIEKLPTKMIETYSEGYPVEEDFLSEYEVMKILKSAANATNGKNGG